jgi:hypothetical protein
MFFELCESPAMCCITQLLMKLLFNAILTDLLKSKSEEELEMYRRGEAIHHSHRSCSGDFKDKDSVYYDGVNTQIFKEVDRQLDEIGPDFLPRFFKLCELSGFPPELCDLKNGSHLTLICGLITHLTNLSMEIKEADVGSENFLGLLKAYSKLQSIFYMREVIQFLSALPQKEQDEIMLERFESILNVDLFEFKILQVRAYMCLAQTEQDLEKLRFILAEVVRISSHIVDDQIHWDSKKAQKLAYLHYIIQPFADFLDTQMMKRTSVQSIVELPLFNFLDMQMMKRNLVQSIVELSISEIWTTMHCFVQEILSARDGVYEEIYQSLPDSSIIPREKSLLKQFLKENVTDKVESLRGSRS